MSGFIPDLASWALRGGAGSGNDNNNNNNDNNNTSTSPAGPPLSEQEVRARRLARMDELQQQQQQQQQQGVQPMEVDAVEAASTTPSISSPQNGKPPVVATVVKEETPRASRKDPPQQQTQQDQKKKRSKESSSTSNQNPSSDPNRKNHRKKELMLKKVLFVTLPEAGVGDAACVALDVDITSITVQTIAELLAARLSLSPEAPELVTLPSQKKAVIPYLAQCHRRASEELKSIRQSTKSLESELEEILEEIRRQVVSYAASSLIMPDLFEMGKDGAAELAKCLITTDISNSITFGVSGLASSFYYCLCEELLSQDSTTFENLIGEVVSYLTKELSKCETVLEGNGTSDGGGLLYVSALTSVCAHKKAAACMTRLPTFLLPPAGDPQASERVRPPMPQLPTTSTTQQRRFFHLMQALNGPGYLRRSGPALDRETVLGLCLRLGCPRENPAVSSPFTSVLQTFDSVERSTTSQRHQLRAYQESCNQFIRALVTAGPDARSQVGHATAHFICSTALCVYLTFALCTLLAGHGVVQRCALGQHGSVGHASGSNQS